MAELLASSEENCRRIARIESCFGAAGRPLMAPGRVLVGEGTLTKLCRKGPKPRQFFLFNDMVVYGAAVLGNRRYANQRVLALEAVTICTLPDEGELSNGWLMQTPAKSFKVFAATESERAEWIGHIERCVRELRAKRGLPPLPAPCNSPGPGGAGASSVAAATAAASPADGSEPAAWWVPDSSASACMRCQRSRFNALNRRHHCRKCGIVVCGACSDRRFLLPSQSSRPLRVCIGCFDSLTAAAATAPAGPPSSSSAADDDLVDRVAKVTVANGNRGLSGAAEEGRPAVSRGRRGDSSRTSNGTQDSSDDDDDDDDDGGDGGRGGGSGEDWADRSPIGNRTGFYS